MSANPSRVLLLICLLPWIADLSVHAEERARNSPADQFGQRLSDLSLTEQRQLLRDWSVNVALTDLGNAASQVEQKFAGVRAMSRVIQQSDFTGVIDVPALTYRNSDYWRGVMEMAPGNYLVAVMPALMHLANGEWDQARRLLSLLGSFSPGENPPAVYLADASRHLDLCIELMNRETRRGIALHDQGKYDEAIAIYQHILASGVQSAWVRYELFFSTASKGGKEGMIAAMNRAGPAGWADAAREIYAMDPLYTTQFSAKRGKDMAAFMDRLALRSMLDNKKLAASEKVAIYADLALKLEDYPVAAHLYWYSLGIKDGGLATDERLMRFLYCLDKCGVSDLKKNFKGNFPKKFKQLDAQLAKHRAS